MSLFLDDFSRTVTRTKITGLQMEMIVEAAKNDPQASLVDVVSAVFDSTGTKLSKVAREGVCSRIVLEGQKSAASPSKPVKKPKKSGAFAKEFLAWMDKLPGAEKLLVAVNFNYPLAKQIYTAEDYTVADAICSRYLEDRMNQGLMMLQAAVAPWVKSERNSEEIDLTLGGAEAEAGWDELGALLSGGSI